MTKVDSGDGRTGLYVMRSAGLLSGDDEVLFCLNQGHYYSVVEEQLRYLEVNHQSVIEGDATMYADSFEGESRRVLNLNFGNQESIQEDLCH